MNKINSEKDLLKKLKVDDIKTIPKEKIKSFIELIPYIDKEIAILAIENLPFITDFIGQMNICLSDTYKAASKSLSETDKATIEAYKQVLEDLRTELKNPELTKDMRHEIIEKEIEVANYISMINEKNHIFWNDAVSTAKEFVTVFGSILLFIFLLKKKK